MFGARELVATMGLRKPRTILTPFEGKDVLKGRETDLHYLIHYSERDDEGEWVVYVDQELDLEYEYFGAIEQALEQRSRKELFGEIISGIAAIEPIAHNWPDDLKLQSKRSMGEAVVAVFRGDSKGARAALVQAQLFVAAKSKQVSRYWILSTSLSLGFVAIVLGTISLLLRGLLLGAIGATGYVLTLCFLSGCIGAVLFIVMRLGSQPVVDSTSERHLHYLEGCARVVGGGLSGVLVGAMIKLGLVLPIFSQPDKQTLAMCAAAMIAGASERLAAGIITKVENGKGNRKEKRNGNQ